MLYWKNSRSVRLDKDGKLRKVTMGSITSVFLAIIVISCAWTSMNSQINTEYSNRQYQKILVFVDLYDLGDKQSAEIRIQDERGCFKRFFI